MNRFYYIDKPLWISSFDVVRNIRKKLNIRKIGHTGTLDPLATWGILLATGSYTKLIPYLEKWKKTYEFIVSLNWVSESFDLGEIPDFLDESFQEKYKKEISLELIEDVLNKNFRGKIMQVPPKYSAVKIWWKRAYDLARSGENLEMKAREIEIFDIEVLKFCYPLLNLKAEVSAWTYIRSIASDLGKILGSWWFISELRRIKIGDLNISLAQSLEDFDMNKFLNVWDLFKNEFISLDSCVLSKINDWLRVKGDFGFSKNVDLFVRQGDEITNIVFYDWEFLFPRKRLSL